MNHPNHEQWMSYLYGEASSEEQASLVAHLHECEACSGQLQQWQAVGKELDAWQLFPAAVKPAPQQTFQRTPLPPAAIELAPRARKSSPSPREERAGRGSGERGITLQPANANRKQNVPPLPRPSPPSEGGEGEGLSRSRTFSLNSMAVLPGPLASEGRGNSVRADSSISAAPLLRWAAAIALLAAGFGLGRLAQAKLDAQKVHATIVPEIRQQLRQEFEAKRLEDNRSLYGALQKVDSQRLADYVSLKKELDTVAVLTDAGLRNAEQQLTQLANYAQATTLPTTSPK